MRNSLIAFILGFILCFLLLRQCTPVIPKGSHTETTYTVYVPGDSIKVVNNIPKPYPVNVYVASDDIKRLNYCDSVRYYIDSTKIDSTTLFIAQDSVNGIKLWSNRIYLSRPYTRQITTTITDSIPYAVKTFKHGIYIKGEIGMSKTNYNLSAGIDYISKKNWSVGYRRDFLQKSHNLSVGYRLF